jgi:hypothetical protein
MSTRNITLTAIGLVVVVAGLMTVRYQVLVDPPAKFIIYFGSHVQLADKAGFVAVLRRASWYRQISFSPQDANDPHGDFTGVTTASSTVHKLTITQDSIANPNTLHVTQRVGLTSPNDVKDLLSKIRE